MPCPTTNTNDTVYPAGTAPSSPRSPMASAVPPPFRLRRPLEASMNSVAADTAIEAPASSNRTYGPPAMPTPGSESGAEKFPALDASMNRP